MTGGAHDAVLAVDKGGQLLLAKDCEVCVGGGRVGNKGVLCVWGGACCLLLTKEEKKK